MSPFNHETFQRIPLVGILRNFDSTLLPSLVQAFISAGLTTLEITLNTPDAFEQINVVQTQSQGRLNIGAGTVTSLSLLHRALKAGASFIVTPNLNPELIQSCADLEIPIFAGAYSPSEIVAAHELGATAVKIFPAETLSPSHFKTLSQTFPQVPLMPTGGVTLQTLPLLLQAGAVAFGIGSPLFPQTLLKQKDWPALENHLKSFVMTYQTALEQT